MLRERAEGRDEGTAEGRVVAGYRVGLRTGPRARLRAGLRAELWTWHRAVSEGSKVETRHFIDMPHPLLYCRGDVRCSLCYELWSAATALSVRLLLWPNQHVQLGTNFHVQRGSKPVG